jgi:hypothetical protein
MPAIIIEDKKRSRIKFFINTGKTKYYFDICYSLREGSLLEVLLIIETPTIIKNAI